MMSDFTDHTEERGQFLSPLPVAGERWRRLAVAAVQRRRSKQPWLQRATKIQKKYADAGVKFESLKNRVYPENARSPDANPAFSPTRPEIKGDTAQDFLPSELPIGIKRSSHFMLDARLKNFLSRLLDIRIPAVKIYTNHAANTFTQKYGADALTYQNNILFRSGKYAPQAASGLALLGHELTHAAQAKLSGQSQASSLNPPPEEQEALVNEARVLQHVQTGTYFPPSTSLSSSRGFSKTSYASTLRTELSSTAQGSFSIPRTPVSSRSEAGYGTVQTSLQASSLNQSLPVQRQPSRLSPYPRSAAPAGLPRAALSSREVGLPGEPSSGVTMTPALSHQQLAQIKEDIYRDLMERIRTEFERGG